VAGGLGVTTYGYHAQTGSLETVNDGMGGVFTYAYNNAGLVDHLTKRNGTVEQFVYDVDGQLTRRTETTPASLALHDDVLSRDAQGRVLDPALPVARDRRQGHGRERDTGDVCPEQQRHGDMRRSRLARCGGQTRAGFWSGLRSAELVGDTGGHEAKRDGHAGHAESRL
jgi:YD repeat-containing protein